MFRRRILFGAVVAGLAASLAGCAPVGYAGYGRPVVYSGGYGGPVYAGGYYAAVTTAGTAIATAITVALIATASIIAAIAAAMATVLSWRLPRRRASRRSLATLGLWPRA